MASVPSPDDPDYADVTFAVREVLKGADGVTEVVAKATYYSDGGGDSCGGGQWGPGRELIGEELIVLLGESGGSLFAWEGCGSPLDVSQRDAVLDVAAPATSSGPVAYLVAGAHPGADVAALDRAGASVGYRPGDAFIADIDACGSGHLQTADLGDRVWELSWIDHTTGEVSATVPVPVDTDGGWWRDTVCVGDGDAVVIVEGSDPPETTLIAIAGGEEVDRRSVPVGPQLVGVSRSDVVWADGRTIRVEPIDATGPRAEIIPPASVPVPRWVGSDPAPGTAVVVSAATEGRDRRFDISVLALADQRGDVSATYSIGVDVGPRGTPPADRPFRRWSASMAGATLIIVDQSSVSGWLSVDLATGSFERVERNGQVVATLPGEIWMQDYDTSTGDPQLIATAFDGTDERPLDFDGEAVTAVASVSPSQIDGLETVPSPPVPRPGIDLTRFAPNTLDQASPRETTDEAGGGPILAGQGSDNSDGAISSLSIAVGSLIIAAGGAIVWTRHRRQP